MGNEVVIKGINDIDVIKNRIYEVRGQRVMLDRDLAELYNVETKVLNQAVKRNIERFPEDFMFRMDNSEWEFLRSQFVTSKIVPLSTEYEEDNDSRDVLRSQFVTSKDGRGGVRYTPYVFTELGIAMLSSVLRSETAIQVNINIMRAFVMIRQAVAAWQDTNLKVEQVFKTLVLRGDKTGLFVCVIPGAEEVDLKKAAKVTGNKKVEMIHVKELLPLTGYIRGGCSPIGMKKPLPTWFHQTLTDYDTVYCSAGQRGLQFRLAPQELVRAAKGTLADLIV